MASEILHQKENRFPFETKEWFQSTQMTENVWAIREPHHDQDVVSYLIQGNTQDILVDSGMGLADIRSTIPFLKRDKDKKLTTLITHTHWDHVGGASDLPNVRVSDEPSEVSRLSSGWKPGEMPGFSSEYFIDIDIPSSYSAENFEVPGVSEFQVFYDGDVIDLGNDKLSVIGTPGHTPGSSSFYLEKAGYLFTGDTLYVGPLYLHMKESDYETFLSSVRKLASSIGHLKLVFPAHNDTLLSAEKFHELVDLINGVREPDFTESGKDEFNIYNQVGWNMKDMGENRTFSLLLPATT